MHDNSVSTTDFNALHRDPTPFEVIRALVEGRLLLEAFEAGEPPPEFEEAWSDDLERAYDLWVEIANRWDDADVVASMVAYRAWRKGRR